MKVLITGGAGFIGSHLVDACLEAGDEVLVLDDLSTGRCENLSLAEKNSKFRFIKGSVEDAALVQSCVEDVDLIYHLAAAVGVRMVIQSPIQTIQTNFQGTRLVLEACAQKKRKVILASTSEVYGKGVGKILSESDELILGKTSTGRWAYACSKALDEFMTFAYAKERGLRFVILRYFNTIGPRQLAQHGMVLPRFLEQAQKNEPLSIFGDGSQIRSFAHVKDTVHATRLLACEAKAEGEIVNVGNSQPISILELAKKVISTTGSSSSISHIDPRDYYDQDFEDMQVRIPDVSKLQRLTSFSPMHTLEQAIQDATIQNIHKTADG